MSKTIDSKPKNSHFKPTEDVLSGQSTLVPSESLKSAKKSENKSKDSFTHEEDELLKLIPQEPSSLSTSRSTSLWRHDKINNRVPVEAIQDNESLYEEKSPIEFMTTLLNMATDRVKTASRTQIKEEDMIADLAFSIGQQSTLGVAEDVSYVKAMNHMLDQLMKKNRS